MSPRLLPSLMYAVKRLAPAGLKQYVKAQIQRSNYLGEAYRCPVCDTGLAYYSPMPDYYFLEFDRYQYRHSIFTEETFNIRQYLCPNCGATDRERLAAMYCKEAFRRSSASRKIRLLEFAPNPAFAAFLRGGPVEYRSADLHNPAADDRVDITNMAAYPAERFDAFVCSHVLEHVPDDRQAMRELHRVLAFGGWGIVMVPINLALEDVYEDAAVVSEEDRWSHFGQHDHVRLYSKAGFVNRLERAGFAVRQLGSAHFGPPAFARGGINPRSVLYVVEKRPVAAGDPR